MQSIYSSILKSKKLKRKQFALLIDPDKFDLKIIKLAEVAGIDFIMVGGSILTNGNFEQCVQMIKESTSIPVIIFPGNQLQISKNADAMLLLSLISGRNPELLIGKHVIAAPVIKSSNLEVLSTGYMLIESGKQTAALYMSNTHPIPYDKDDIAMCTAIAGELLGMKLIYLDAGSGAMNPVSESMIKKVSENIQIPLILGGGINSPGKAILACKAGADIIVIGNAIEKDPQLIQSISKAIHKI
ncbi:MAG: geranylgeranylglyceryl/heptaprenylglyceryl phosphate synthase [Bacteroidota bacterium]